MAVCVASWSRSFPSLNASIKFGGQVISLHLIVNGSSSMNTKPLNSDSKAEYWRLDFEVKNIYALGLSYEDHIKEVGESPGNPVVFSKVCRPSIGESTQVLSPSSDDMLNAIEKIDHSRAKWLRGKIGCMPCLLDYEVEVGLILLEDASLTQLDDVNFHPRIAYVLTNDITVRSVQIAGEGMSDKLQFWAASKSFPGFLPMADQVWVPNHLDADRFPEFTLETYVNGEKRQSASTSQILYSPRQILRKATECTKNDRLSKFDMILTGTPSGIGLTIPLWKRRLAACLPSKLRILSALRTNTHNPKLLKPGDIVTVKGGVLGEQTTKIASAA